MPSDDAVHVSLEFPGLDKASAASVQTLAIRGNVLVERAEPKRLDLVDEEGQRVSLYASSSSSVSFTGVAIGTRFWLSAWERFEKPNPFAWVSSQAFSLRTEEDGPVLLATLKGATDDGDGTLGLPISIQPSCTAETTFERGAGNECLSRFELFEAVLDADPTVRVLPGTSVMAQIDGATYDVALQSAQYLTYPDTGAVFSCTLADWTPILDLDFNVVSSQWPELAAKQAVEIAALPACHLGTDAPLVSIDTDQLDWERFSGGSAELPIALSASDDDSLVFSSDYGSLRVTGDSEALAVLERAQWLSLEGYYTQIFRETAGGDALVAYSQTTVEIINALAQRSDVLGSSIAFEPRCDWLSDACPVVGGAQAIALHDVVYGDGTRVPSHEKGVVSGGTRLFDAWVAVTPSCRADPAVTAIFVALTE